MTDYEQAVVKYLSLIAQELVRISEAILDTDKKKVEIFEPKKREDVYIQEVKRFPEPETRPSFIADNLEIPSEPKIKLEK